MLLRTLAGAVIAVGAALSMLPAAGADPADPNDPYGFNAFQDRTDYFVAPTGAGAILGSQKNKPIILSPYGTTRRIECRGDGHYVAVHECRQYDVNNVPHELRLLENPIRPIYLYM